jgi:hypothetical protein
MEGCKCKLAKSYAERIIEYREFVSLVKRMREAQKKFGGEVDVCIGFEEGLDEMWHLEDKVDELLKKME